MPCPRDARAPSGDKVASGESASPAARAPQSGLPNPKAKRKTESQKRAGKTREDYGPPVKRALPVPCETRSLCAQNSVRSALSHDGLHPAHSIRARVLMRDTGSVRAPKTLSEVHPLRLPTALVYDNLYFGKLVGRYARTRSNPGLAAACWEGPWIPGRTVPNRPRSRVCFTWQVPPLDQVRPSVPGPPWASKLERLVRVACAQVQGA